MIFNFSKFFGGKSVSKSLAKSRLHFVLVQDRTGLTNDEMANFKKEMVSVIEKYFVIDKKGFDIEYKRDTDLTTLVINSPIVVRRQESIHHEVGSGKRREKQRDRQKAKGSESAHADEMSFDDGSDATGTDSSSEETSQNEVNAKNVESAQELPKAI